jgi:hypothetical protein
VLLSREVRYVPRGDIEEAFVPGYCVSKYRAEETRTLRRTLVAFFVAPLLPALAPAWSLHIVYPNRTAISGYIIACFVFYVMQAVVGIPAYMLGRSRRAHILFYLLIGFLGLAIPFVVASIAFWTSRFSNYEVFLMALYFGTLGAGTGLIFWLAARPDKRSPAKPIAPIFE